MFVLQEFELFEDEGYVLAFPFGLEGGTQGRTYEEAAEMAADWLKGMVEHWLMVGEEPPAPSLGNEPRNGGRILLVGVEAGLGDIETVAAAEAAEALGVSRPRVTQMLRDGTLTGYRDGRNTRVTVASLRARLDERPRPGRPRKAEEHAPAAV